LKKIQRVIEEKSMEKRTPSLSNNDVSDMTVAHPNEQIKFLEYLIEMPEDSTQEIGLI
jgi:hypothetical protein